MERVRRDTREALRAGATTTPTLFGAGEVVAGAPSPEWIAGLSAERPLAPPPR